MAALFRHDRGDGGDMRVARRWDRKTRLPICPYGCGEEGQFIEMVQDGDTTYGIYQDSEQLKFAAKMESVKPNQKELIIGPSGELQEVSGD